MGAQPRTRRGEKLIEVIRNWEPETGWRGQWVQRRDDENWRLQRLVEFDLSRKVLKKTHGKLQKKHTNVGRRAEKDYRSAARRGDICRMEVQPLCIRDDLERGDQTQILKGGAKSSSWPNSTTKEGHVTSVVGRKKDNQEGGELFSI